MPRKITRSLYPNAITEEPEVCVLYGPSTADRGHALVGSSLQGLPETIQASECAAAGMTTSTGFANRGATIIPGDETKESHNTNLWISKMRRGSRNPGACWAGQLSSSEHLFELNTTSRAWNRKERAHPSSDSTWVHGH